jgi:hypothetical protein
MSLDDAAGILDCTEEHVKDLLRDGHLTGHRFTRAGYEFRYRPGRRGFVLPLRRGRKAAWGQWFVNGREVRARRRRLVGGS